MSVNVIVGYQSLLKLKVLMRLLHPFNESVYTPSDRLNSGIPGILSLRLQ